MTRAGALLGSVAFLALAPGTVAGVVPWWISRWEVRRPFLGAAELRLAGAALVALGAAALLDSFARFALHGLGTPAPVLPTRHLVVSGLYRHVRNPMYVGVVSVILGQALLLGDGKLLVYALAVWLAVHAFVVGYEEPTLLRAHGEEYVAFRENVPRWMPRVRPWRGGGRSG
jgi:protein-S-isoprenylcysteine O-methyltransferase Ste14